MTSLPFGLTYRALATSVVRTCWPGAACFAAGVTVGALAALHPPTGLVMAIAVWVALFVGIFLG